jgi:hypothetical protein
MNFAIFKRRFMVNLTKYNIKNAQVFLGIFDIIIIFKIMLVPQQQLNLMLNQQRTSQFDYRYRYGLPR